MLSVAITIVLSFLLGSFPTGYLVGKIRGVDIRKTGSGNIGATNVFRILGKKWGIFVLIVDVLKGWLACYCLPGLVQSWLNVQEDGVLLKIVASLAVVSGHNFSPWLGFRGGKGIVTSAGIILGLMPNALGLSLILWLSVFLISRYVSFASVVTAVFLPLAVWYTQRSLPMIFFAAAIGGMAVFRHKKNIQRLIQGTENRFEFGGKKTRET